MSSGKPRRGRDRTSGRGLGRIEEVFYGKLEALFGHFGNGTAMEMPIF
jgi:hypothetical protein